MDHQDHKDEIAAASSDQSSKRYSSLLRFANLLIDQTLEAKLNSNELRFIAAHYKNSIELFASEAERR